MTDRQDGHRDDAEKRIEDARSEVAAYVIQSQPAEGGDVDETEGRIADAIQDAEQETDASKLDELAAKVEAGRDEIRSELFGTATATPEPEATTKDQATQTDKHIEMREGDDFVCPNCGCEIMLKHHGDPARMPRMQMFTCCCGTPMKFEHPRGTGTA